MLQSRSMATPDQAALAPSSPAIALGFYAFFVLVIVAGMLRLLGGTLGYTLDDPYIHLALAERIALGHYGINLSEVTAPSSSVIWPFLLLPGVGTEWHIWVPLGINLLCGAAAALVIGVVVDRLPWPDGTGLLRAACVLVLMLVGNLAGLPFTGMEHSPQVLVAAICALAVVEGLRDRPIPFWCLVVAALGPAIRYELFAMAGALAVVLAGQRRWGAAAGLLAASLVLPLAFGAWLVSQDLPPLPNSVLAKSDAYAEIGGLLHLCPGSGPGGRPGAAAAPAVLATPGHGGDHHGAGAAGAPGAPLAPTGRAGGPAPACPGRALRRLPL